MENHVSVSLSQFSPFSSLLSECTKVLSNKPKLMRSNYTEMIIWPETYYRYIVVRCNLKTGLSKL